jgi:hypothetical protein
MSSLYLWKENRGKTTKKRRNLEMLITFCQLSLLYSWEKSLSWFTPLFDNHGATHPTGERWKPGSADSEENQDALADLGSAVQSLDEVELDESRGHRH